MAKGDLSQKITVDTQGEVATLAETLNTMVDQLSSFAGEVTRVAREVGTEGKLGGQAEVAGVSGTWRDLTENVNFMAGNLTSQVRNIAQIATAVAKGDLSQKITVDAKGEVAALAQTINTMVDQLSSFADEVTRVAREVGTEGKLGGQAEVEGVSGTWKDLTDNVNFMAGNLTSQVRNIALVTTAVAQGDLSQKITVDAKGARSRAQERTINTMVDQLSFLRGGGARVARVRSAPRASSPVRPRSRVSGTWKDLTDNVNFMASNLTSQVRNIALVTTAVAQGDLSQKITVDAQGEILDLKSTVNTMVDQLSAFAAEVTRVAREVGTEGKLGGQAEVAGRVSGTWRHLTENVNQLAGNLTTQVRAIAEVSTAVTRGDLTRSINVEAQGEVAELKDNINQMIANLRSTTEINAQQDWLKSNLAHRRAAAGPARPAGRHADDHERGDAGRAGRAGRLLSSPDGPEGPDERWSWPRRTATSTADDRIFGIGRAWSGGRRSSAASRSAVTGRAARTTSRSARAWRLGSPADLVVLPVLFEEQVLGVIELASFSRFNEVHAGFLEQLVETIGVVLNTIIANVRTEELLAQSSASPRSCRCSRSELQRTNAELEDKARLLTEQSSDLEIKNREIETARLGRGQGRAAGAVLAVQVGVPGQHEPRAAHAAEQPADPGQAARGQPAEEPVGQADGVRPHDPQRRV